MVSKDCFFTERQQRLPGSHAHLETMELRVLRHRPEAYVSRTRGGSTETCISLHGIESESPARPI